MKVATPGLLGSREGGWVDDVLLGVGACYLTSLFVLVGLLSGSAFVKPYSPEIALLSVDMTSACIRFDGCNYADIAEHGYSYNPDGRSGVAFFPAYPAAVAATCLLTNCGHGSGLLVVSNAALAAAFILMARLVRHQAGSPIACWSVAAFGLWPSTFFFRMPYAESFLLCGLLLTLYGCHRHWHPALVAVCAGFATGTRPVGVAAAMAAIWYVAASPGSLRRRTIIAAVLTPVACWGLLAYMAYLYIAFGDPLAFARTQHYFTYRLPPGGSKILSLLTLEPLWGVYDPSSPRYWHQEGDFGFLFNMNFWNPILFVGTGAAVAAGIRRGWLSGPSIIIGISLLVIPYVTRAYEMSMASHGRFAAAVVVIYPIFGRLLAAAPAAISLVTLSACGVFLACWTALFTASYEFF